MISTYVIKEKQSLYSYLKSRFISDKVINLLIDKKLVERQNELLLADTNLFESDIITINYSGLETNIKQDTNKGPINIIYENSEIICLDKTEEILIHSDGSSKENLLAKTVNYLKAKGDDSYLRVVHRIDVKTRGIVVFAKNIVSYQEISRQLETNTVIRKYLAVVWGMINTKKTLVFAIGRDRHNSNKYLVTKKGKEAITIINPLKHKKDKTLLEIYIKTGRTHQIRFSLAHIGHNIVGDDLYGKDEKNKLMLVSKQFGFILDNQKYLLESKIKLEV